MKQKKQIKNSKRKNVTKTESKLNKIETGNQSKLAKQKTKESVSGISKLSPHGRDNRLLKKIGILQLNRNTLLFILFVGFILRIIPILWGIPINPYIRSYHPDEAKVLNSILSFPEIYWTTKPFAGYGTAVQYIIGIILFPIKFLFFKTHTPFQEYLIIAQIFSRFISIVLGTGSIYLTFLVAKKIYDEKIAILSAAFLSLSFYHTLNSALITLDVSSSFILMLNFFLCFRAIETNRWRDYIFLGIASGILVGTKTVLGIFFCIPFILNFLKRYYPQNKSNPDKTILLQQAKNLLSYVVTAAIVFIIFHPHIFLDIDKYIAFYMREKHDWIDRSRGTILQLFHTWGANTIKGIGLFVPFFALIGAIVPGKKNLRFKLMLLLFIILYYGFWRWFLSARYLIVISPIICIFAANACMIFIDKENKILKTLAAAMITIAIGFSLYWCISGIFFRINETRLDASEFIAQNIPAGTTIGVSGVSEKYDWRTHSWKYPKINFKRYRVVNFLSKPEILIINSNDYDQIIKTIDSGKLLNDYVLPKAYYKDWYRYSAPSPRIFKFYDEMRRKKNKNGYILIKEFQSNVNVPLEFAPPEIKIYKKIM